MSKKTIVLVVVGILVLVGAAIFYFFDNQSASLASQGKAVIGISDASAAIPNVTSIVITVDTVEVQNATQGWITVSSGTKQYDLLQLERTGAIALLADATLPVGTYDQIRLTISKVVITASGTAQEAKLPSGMLQIVGRLVVEEGKTATAVLDFNAGKSLLMAADGRFVLAPVVNLRTERDAVVQESPDHMLTISSGTTEADVNVGMDEHGDIKDDFELGSGTKIEIDSEDVIHIATSTRGEDSTSSRSEGGDQKKSGQNSGDSQGRGEVKLNLSTENNSGIAGTATLQEEDGKVKVSLKLFAVPTGVAGLAAIPLDPEHPAHIHLGACPGVGAVKYPLASTVNGESETTINASLADLKAQLPLSLNVHKSAAEIGVYVACVDLKF